MNERGFREEPVLFHCGDAQLPGILHHPRRPSRIGVLIIVGGPQYRVGSHRQFVLLARDLAAAGFPVMRFDYRGMGDAGGEFLGFEGIGKDIGAAMDAFLFHCPGLERVVLWGLCDAASAALFYAPGDARVGGLVLLNPWVRTEQGAAEAMLKHYYVRRIFGVALWKKILSGRFDFAAALRSLMEVIRSRANVQSGTDTALDLPRRMAAAFRQFSGPALIILSGNDLTAAEFSQVSSRSPQWSRIMGRPDVTTRELSGANHTFSSALQRARVSKVTEEWLTML